MFRGSYQERPVAVKVVQLYSNNREAALRVGAPVMSDNGDDLSDVWSRDSAKRR